ncbi:hypothetical protein [Paenibacillus aceris]|uniref:Uncharacterized protein n=1 Tax=Paenibacillus aceris TaxID=869555 RepID=A0ABS4I489_9BACL|nr:hypothetical protein [Paenibacillus aceris]MBP1965728.1 hypothetical protein [Paenibacillus aceris]NHW34931.1 hypothetical protein [Paenibacillus aceris]
MAFPLRKTGIPSVRVKNTVTAAFVLGEVALTMKNSVKAQRSRCISPEFLL